MVFKINIGEKSGKTYKFETESTFLIDKELHDKIPGKELKEELEGYEFEITGASDKSGFTAMESVLGTGLKKVLLGYGKGMHKKPRKEGKKKLSNHNPKGLRLRKTVRGKTLSPEISQINLKVIKEGKKSLKDIFEPKTEEQTEKLQ
jgi:small subunit ribosomal protein S6e